MQATELNTKQLEILKEALPQSTRFGVLWNPHLVAGIGLWRARSDRYRRAARFLTLGQSSCHSKRTKIAVITSRSSGTE